MEKTGTKNQQHVFPHLSFPEVAKGNIEQQNGKCLPDNAEMHKQQVGDQHDETHLRNILAMLGNKP